MTATINIPRPMNVGKAIQNHFNTPVIITEIVDILRDTKNKQLIAKVNYKHKTN